MSRWDRRCGEDTRHWISTHVFATFVRIARVLDQTVVAGTAVDLVLAAAERDDEVVALPADSTSARSRR